MALSALDRLRLFLRPPGRGIATFSTGSGYASRLLNRLYGTDQPEAVQEAWEETLQRIRRVGAILLGVPSDTGAGLLRGANFGPMGIREAYLKHHGAYPKELIDIGDVLCVPQLLHDEMLSDGQIAATRKALYPGAEGEGLPVSALSLAERAIRTVLELNPKARILVLGGDHSVSWPAVAALHGRGGDFGILHFDAHSDLLSTRLGVTYCFATWAFHAHRLLKPRALVQVGLRASTRSRGEWEAALPVRQFWAKEVPGREAEVAADIVEHFQSIGIGRIYVSNDIDGTDAAAAPATGTPEREGLTPQFVRALVREVARHCEVIGGDVVEVAPPLAGHLEFADEPTCRLGADYLQDLIAAALK